jgi:hypothetical protein
VSGDLRQAEVRQQFCNRFAFAGDHGLGVLDVRAEEELFLRDDQQVVLGGHHVGIAQIIGLVFLHKGVVLEELGAVVELFQAVQPVSLGQVRQGRDLLGKSGVDDEDGDARCVVALASAGDVPWVCGCATG